MKYIVFGLFVVWSFIAWLNGATGYEIGEIILFSFFIFALIFGPGGGSSREPWGGG